MPLLPPLLDDVVQRLGRHLVLVFEVDGDHGIPGVVVLQSRRDRAGLRQVDRLAVGRALEAEVARCLQ